MRNNINHRSSGKIQLHEYGCGCSTCASKSVDQSTGQEDNHGLGDFDFVEFVIEPYEYNPLSRKQSAKSNISQPQKSLLGPNNSNVSYGIQLDKPIVSNEDEFYYNNDLDADDDYVMSPMAMQAQNYPISHRNVDGYQEDFQVNDDYTYIEDSNTYSYDDYSSRYEGYSEFDNSGGMFNESNDEEVDAEDNGNEDVDPDDLLLDSSSYGDWDSVDEEEEDSYSEYDFGNDEEEEEPELEDSGYQSIIITTVDDKREAYHTLLSMGLNDNTANEIATFAANGSEMFLGSYSPEEVEEKTVILSNAGIGYRVENEKNPWSVNYTREDDDDDFSDGSNEPESMSMEDAVNSVVDALEDAGMSLDLDMQHIGLIRVLTPVPMITVKRIVDNAIPTSYGMDLNTSKPIVYISLTGIDIQF
jgi:hypothetical protein